MASGIFLDVYFESLVPNGTVIAARVKPTSLSTDGKGRVSISHDCCSAGEIDYVIDQMQRDLEVIRKKAHAKLAGKRA